MRKNECMLCPRKCGADRSEGTGFCGGGNLPKIAKVMLHFGEEPCISGTKGSGAVFFSGCVLKCRFCQNYPISSGNQGRQVSVERLSRIFLSLQEKGAHNINLVTPTHYTEQIKAALDLIKGRLNIPVVYNCGGYESVETIRGLKGYIDIYLTDMKYRSSQMSAEYSGARDYFAVASEALREMISQTGGYKIKDGIMQSGVIVRHLILPMGYKDSISILDWLNGNISPKDYLLSLMSQYTPCYDAEKIPAINRRITTFEYRKVLSKAQEYGIDGFMQERASATLEMTPDWSDDGIDTD